MKSKAIHNTIWKLELIVLTGQKVRAKKFDLTDDMYCIVGTQPTQYYPVHDYRCSFVTRFTVIPTFAPVTATNESTTTYHIQKTDRLTDSEPVCKLKWLLAVEKISLSCAIIERWQVKQEAATKECVCRYQALMSRGAANKHDRYGSPRDGLP